MPRATLPILLAVALGLSACAQTAQGPNPYGGQTVMTGAAAGAALGALIGAAAGGHAQPGGRGRRRAR